MKKVKKAQKALEHVPLMFGVHKVKGKPAIFFAEGYSKLSTARRWEFCLDTQTLLGLELDHITKIRRAK